MSTWPSPEWVAHKLGGARRSGDGWVALCPCHEDKKPSLSIGQGKDGRLLVNCHAGCDQRDIIEELVRRDLWREKRDKRSQERSTWKQITPVPTDAPKLEVALLLGIQPTAMYAYKSGRGQLLGYVCRIEDGSGGKQFRPLTFGEADGQFRWAARGFATPRPLYGLDRLAKEPTAPVLVVEGEKACDAAQQRLPGHVVVTWPNGAKSVDKADWSPLQGRDVVVWPDADDPGIAAAEKVAEQTEAAGANRVRVVTLPAQRPRGWDLADEIPEGLDVEGLIEAADERDDTLLRFIRTAEELRNADIPPRRSIVDPWLPEAGLAMVYARRGVGKTWFAMSLGLAVARGEDFLGYTTPTPRRVLYFEGEMPLADVQDRLKQLNGPGTADLFILASELMFREGRRFNLNDDTDQESLDRTLTRLERDGRRPDLIIIDNLSSLGGGTDENSNSDLDKLLQWMLRLRHAGYTVLMVHHAGKGGDQRGASRREDLLDTTISLKAPVDPAASSAGAVFDLEFTKTRGRSPNPRSMRLSLRPDEDGRLQFHTQRSPKKVPPHKRTLLGIYRGQRTRPFASQKEIAEKLNLSPGTISQHLKRLRNDDLVADVADGIRVTEAGVEALRASFGDRERGDRGWVAQPPKRQSDLDFV